MLLQRNMIQHGKILPFANVGVLYLDLNISHQVQSLAFVGLYEF